jgi:arylsulfatase A
VSWPARIKPGVSEDLVSTIDVAATVCAAAGVPLPKDALPDSYNLLPSMLGSEGAPRRDHLVLMSGTGHLALRSGDLKYMPDLNFANGWKGGHIKPGSPARPALYDLSTDPGEKKNLFEEKPHAAKRLADLLAKAKSSPVTRPQ